MLFTSFSDFSAAVRSLRASTPLRFVLRYGARARADGSGLLVVRATNDAQTLMFKTNSRSDLREIDALSLWLLEHDTRDASAAAHVATSARERPAGSGAQRRKLARDARAAIEAGGAVPARTGSKYKRAKERRAAARVERRKARAEENALRSVVSK